MELIRTNIKSIIIALLLILGVVVTVYLAQQRQILKSRAVDDASTLIEITDEQGNQLQPESPGSSNFKTNSRNLRIQVKDFLPED